MTIALLKNNTWLLVILGIALSFILVKLGVAGILMLAIIGPGVVYLNKGFQNAKFLVAGLMVMSFLVSMLSRYVPGIPYGLSIDGFLVLLIIGLLFNEKESFQPAKNPITSILLIWLIFSVTQIANPLAKSTEAWIYANRGLSVYPLLFVIIGTVYYRKRIRQKWLLNIWICLAFVGTIWGIKQLYLGVSETERIWLAQGAASTHILFGRLRVFSFFSDSAQFGAAQAHIATICGIMAFFPGKLKHRWLFAILALLFFYGMLISGTRGSLAIIAFGGFTYLLLSKNFKIILVGCLGGVMFFAFLKYTSIGQSNYQINRLRTALDANDASFQVREQRIAELKVYMKDKPFGGGIGSAGYWGKRFSPGSYLAEIGTDGHYTRVWMETGIVGLTLYLSMLVFIVIFLGKRLWYVTINQRNQLMIAYFSAFVGLLVASYTNGLLIQLPTGPLTFLSLSIVYINTRSKAS